MKVPFLSFDVVHDKLKTEIMGYLESFYDSRRYILGTAVEDFESAFADACGTRHCVGVGCGLDALYLALQALDVGKDDEVIVPSNAYVAAWIAVSRVAARIVPVEPDPRTHNIDPRNIESAITDRTRAIMPVHLFGQPCQMGAIKSIADRHGVRVVEDNAQAHGATCDGKTTGGLGHVNATSFYPTKNLGALGDAGAVTTDDPAAAERVRALRNYGSVEKNRNLAVGINSRLDEIQAGILSIKLEHLAVWNRERRLIADRYHKQLQDIDLLRLPYSPPGIHHVYHLFVVNTAHRDPLRRFLADRGIETLIHYPVPPHLQPAYRDLGYHTGDFPIAEELADTSLSLPMFIGMTREMVDAVAEGITAFFTEEI
jgi:dTDP-4-amino-4,6-dideoxygalactose transaminase